MALLIVAALEQPALVSLAGTYPQPRDDGAREAHDAEEVARAVDAGASVIGVNARNLKTLEVDRDVFARLAPAIPDAAVRVAESGSAAAHDLLAYAHDGADAVLVGESLARGRPGLAVQDLVAAGAHPSVSHLRG